MEGRTKSVGFLSYDLMDLEGAIECQVPFRRRVNSG